jgi:hypothetical protein
LSAGWAEDCAGGDAGAGGARDGQEPSGVSGTRCFSSWTARRGFESQDLFDLGDAACDGGCEFEFVDFDGGGDGSGEAVFEECGVSGGVGAVEGLLRV